MKEVYAYQAILRAEVAVVRGLQVPLSRRGGRWTRLGSVEVLFSTPSVAGGGIHDPEARLSICGVLGAIMDGLAQYYKDLGVKYTPDPGEAAGIFLYLVKQGLLVPLPIKETHTDTDWYCRADDTLGKAVEEVRKRGKIYLKLAYKTVHGELSRLASNAAPLPSRYESSGYLMLPLVEEPLPSTIEALPRSLVKWLDKQCPGGGLDSVIRDSLQSVGYRGLNIYQYRVVDEYFKRRLNGERPDLVLAAPTGGGKTLAFTIVVVTEALARKCRGLRGPTAVLAYPRKTLARDQLEGLAAILYHINRRLAGASQLAQLAAWIRDGSSGVPYCPHGAEEECVELPRSGKSLRGITLPDGSKAVHWYDDNRGVYVSDPWWLLDVKDNVPISTPYGPTRISRPELVADIIVTNYDMLFKESVECLRGSCSGIGSSIITSEILVLDEAHTVLGGRDAVKVQTLTLALELAKKRPSIVVSSATLLERKIIPSAPGGAAVSLRNTVTIRLVRGPSMSEAETAFETLTGWKSRGLVYVDYYNVAAAKPRAWKVTLWSVLYPSIMRSPLTAFNEALVSTAHMMAALRGKSIRRAKAIAFIEYKYTLKEAASQLVRRITLEAGDPHDRVLLTALFNNSIQNLSMLLQSWGKHLPVHISGKRTKAEKEIIDTVENLIRAGIDRAADIIWSGTFSRFHAISPYTRPDDYGTRGPLSRSARNYRDLEDIVKQLVARSGSMSSHLMVTGTWLDSLLEQAGLMSIHAPWANNDNLLSYTKDARSKGIRPGFPLVFHHGDYTGPARLEVDELVLKEHPLLVVATSTLEVGLNVEDVMLTLHFILPREPGRIIQMVGRSGRTESTNYASMGIAVLRHNAWEAPKKVEARAIRYFHEARAPPTPRLREDPYLLAKLCTTLNPDNPVAECDYLAKNATVNPTAAEVAKSVILYSRQIVIDSAKNIRSQADMCPSALFSIQVPFTERLMNALDLLRRACSSMNPSLVAAAAEVVEAVVAEEYSRVFGTRSADQLKGLLDIVSTVRATAYSALERETCKVSHCSQGGLLDQIVPPGGFSIPGAGDVESPSGRVYIYSGEG